MTKKITAEQLMMKITTNPDSSLIRKSKLPTKHNRFGKILLVAASLPQFPKSKKYTAATTINKLSKLDLEKYTDTVKHDSYANIANAIIVDIMKESIAAQSNGGNAKAELTDPIKQWVLKLANEIRVAEPRISKKAIAYKIWDLYFNQTWKRPLKHESEFDTIYRWICNEKLLGRK